MLITLPVLALLPAAVLLITGTAGHSATLEWMALPIGIGWGALLWWGLGRAAQHRLQAGGPELFTSIRRTG
ncbi:hypothetical protein [Streptacidiphilus sp. PAMC 29251]